MDSADSASAMGTKSHPRARGWIEPCSCDRNARTRLKAAPRPRPCQGACRTCRVARDRLSAQPPAPGSPRSPAPATGGTVRPRPQQHPGRLRILPGVCLLTYTGLRDEPRRVGLPHPTPVSTLGRGQVLANLGRNRDLSLSGSVSKGTCSTPGYLRAVQYSGSDINTSSSSVPPSRCR